MAFAGIQDQHIPKQTQPLLQEGEGGYKSQVNNSLVTLILTFCLLSQDVSTSTSNKCHRFSPHPSLPSPWDQSSSGKPGVPTVTNLGRKGRHYQGTRKHSRQKNPQPLKFLCFQQEVLSFSPSALTLISQHHRIIQVGRDLRRPLVQNPPKKPPNQRGKVWGKHTTRIHGFTETAYTH